MTNKKWCGLLLLALACCPAAKAGAPTDPVRGGHTFKLDDRTEVRRFIDTEMHITCYVVTPGDWRPAGTISCVKTTSSIEDFAEAVVPR